MRAVKWLLTWGCLSDAVVFSWIHFVVQQGMLNCAPQHNKGN
jgi:hypothetical protein